MLLALWLPATAAAAPPIVIVLSWDGVRHDYPERVETPALDRMERDGLRAERLVPVFPANTFPAHVSLATGTYIDRHGIVANVFRDRGRGSFRYSNDASWIEAEPLWVAAERQGVPAATFFWVGSETDWHGVGARYRRTPFDTKVPEREKVEQILAWLDLPEAERPRLILSWWHGADHAGHKKGPGDPSVARALAGQDRELGRLLAGLDARALWARTTLFVVSDHGMSEASQGIDVVAELKRAGIAASLVPAGGVGHVWLEDRSQRDRARQLLDALDGARAYPSEAAPPELRASHATRTGDLLVLVEPPYALSLRALGSGNSGMHGYRPEHPDMGAICYALGRAVPAGSRPATLRSIDLAASAAALLGIDPPTSSEGVPFEALELP